MFAPHENVAQIVLFITDDKIPYDKCLMCGNDNIDVGILNSMACYGIETSKQIDTVDDNIP